MFYINYVEQGILGLLFLVFFEDLVKLYASTSTKIIQIHIQMPISLLSCVGKVIERNTL